jgi:hypothetical protein
VERRTSGGEPDQHRRTTGTHTRLRLEPQAAVVPAPGLQRQSQRPNDWMRSHCRSTQSNKIRHPSPIPLMRRRNCRENHSTLINCPNEKRSPQSSSTHEKTLDWTSEINSMVTASAGEAGRLWAQKTTPRVLSRGASFLDCGPASGVCCPADYRSMGSLAFILLAASRFRLSPASLRRGPCVVHLQDFDERM